ncbi:hypothetical protein [Sphingomonas sp. Leaf37]|uniref:hypothetical protein n=1 Tax=Sphingomonas sp. Leaf37 TaxID=2876552 RepID=UPI001E355C53|nr:hypothetical protein [Sphingomonas sp. Leaf37]
MRREVLIRAIDRVLADLRETEIADLVRGAVQSRGNEKGFQIPLGIVLDYIQRTTAYSSAEDEVVEILGLDSARSIDFWQAAITSFEASSFYDLFSSINNATAFLPRVAKLLKREFDDVAPTGSAVSAKLTGLEKQTVILTDEDGDLQSSPDRLVQVLQSISILYSSIADVLNIKTGSIAVVSMDSGSEKAFEFLGVDAIIKEVRETLLVIYNTITFHQQNKAARNLALVAEALPILERLRSMEADAPQDAERLGRLRHNILGSVEKFVDSGAYIPEMNQSESLAPQLLMKPEQKLLTGPSDTRSNPSATIRQDTQGHESTQNRVDHTDFTPEELRRAAELLRMSKPSETETERDVPPKSRRPRNPKAS